jgi:arylformamidase
MRSLLTSAATAAALLALAPAAGAATCPPPSKAVTVAHERIAGVPANSTSLDVWAPAKKCRPKGGSPVVVWVHGGAYQTGDKANRMADKVKLFTGRGYVLVSVNYRLSKAGDPKAANYPDHFRDVAAAVAWVRANIERYGGRRDRIALLGHSAGADIVSNVATDPQWLARHKLKLSTLRCQGPLDTEGFDKTRAGAAEQRQWVVAFSNHPTYKTDTSATLLVKRGIGIPRTFTVFRGLAGRQAIEKAYADALRRAGISATLVDATSLTHEEVNTSIGAKGDTVMTKPLVSFLKACFK